MRLSESLCIEPRGTVEGLALWWSKEISFKILKTSRNYIDTLISCNGEDDWFCIFLYGPSYQEEKMAFWDNLSALRNGGNAKLCLIGDSNMVAKSEEKLGGNPFDPSYSQGYFKFPEESELMEMDIKWGGWSFTSSNQRCYDDAILEMLDQILYK
ncbi:hypothetical protein V6N11_021959 [Hibiscus sabdariffa]|uniref:Uncharacterized protein n=1 Tax=Hibiscus sabdariffa TaxID=183260 RepID=A0ABR2TI43_9ROSI